jgi:hypothetical protein
MQKSISRRTYTPTIVLLVSTVISACGGGGNSSDNTGDATTDTIAPIITLNGNTSITIVQGGTYNELGASADDNTDGDISANIIIGGDTVNTVITGNYTITYDVIDASGNAALQISRVISVSSIPVATTYFMPVLNDTGIQIGGNYPDGNNINCSGETINEQDCSFGRDKQATDSSLIKIGSGSAGFDFTKLGADGAPLAIQNQPWSDTGSNGDGTIWSCIKDNNTNLVWEVKINNVQGGQLHSKDDKYFWYSTDSTNNGGFTGIDKNSNGTSTCTGQDQNDSSTFCNTEAFVGRVNTENLCSANDWRLPNLHELLSITHYGKPTSPSIDTDYFPNNDSSNDVVQNYTTSTSWVMQLSGKDAFTTTDEGGAVKDLRNQAFSARLVRTAQ